MNRFAKFDRTTHLTITLLVLLCCTANSCEERDLYEQVGQSTSLNDSLGVSSNSGEVFCEHVAIACPEFYALAVKYPIKWPESNKQRILIHPTLRTYLADSIRSVWSFATEQPSTCPNLKRDDVLCIVGQPLYTRSGYGLSFKADYIEDTYIIDPSKELTPQEATIWGHRFSIIIWYTATDSTIYAIGG